MNGNGYKRPAQRIGAAAMVLSLGLLLSGCQQQHALPPLTDTTYGSAGPSEVDMLTIGADLSAQSFVDANGDPVALTGGTPWVLLYWASWCPSCKEVLPHADALAETVAQAGATLLLVNKTDGERETRDMALQWLADANINTETVFDMDAVVYDALHMVYVPTVLVLDTHGIVTSFASGGVPQDAVLLSMLEEAKVGKAARMEAVVTSLLMGEDGGIHTSYLPEDGSPTGEDVLSESQGMMMRYAAAAGDMAVFDRVWQYVQEHLTEGGLAQWVSSDTGKTSTVNATLDDLRIGRALLESPGHAEEGDAYAATIHRYATENDRLEDFYDFSLRKHAGVLTLCYADFVAMQQMADRDDNWKAVYDNALAVVTNGRISDAFPLYHARYDYASGTYASDTLHMAEALLTLLHLAEVDRLPPDAYAWLRTRLLEDGYLYTRYTTDGAAASDGLFESSAVYAVTALIAIEQEDLPLARMALTKLEALHVRDVDSPLDGVLGSADGTGIHSFDQLYAMLAYQALEAAQEGAA